MVDRLLTETVEHTIFQFKTILYRLVSHNKIFVGIILMELHELDTVIILFLHHGIRQSVCGEGLSNARSALKDNILLVPENGCKFLVFLLFHIDFIEKLFFGIRINSRFTADRITLPDQIDDEIIFAPGQLKQTAIRIDEKLHLFQFRVTLKHLIIYRRRKSFQLLKE